MNKKQQITLALLLSMPYVSYGHNTGQPHDHEGPVPVALSEQDIRFVLQNQDLALAYIPEVVNSLFIMLKDIAEPSEYAEGLKEFMQLIDGGYHVVDRSKAMKGIFGALALIKQYESTLPQSYTNMMCDILYGYQKSLHKEEQVFHGLDGVKQA